MTGGEVEIRITGAEVLYGLKCGRCENALACPAESLMRRLRDGMPALKIALEVRNPTDTVFSPAADAWELIDVSGQAVGGAAVCERQLPADCVQADLWSVSPGTWVRTMLIFPLTGQRPAFLAYDDGRRSIRLPMPEIAPAAKQVRLRGKTTVKIGRKRKIRITECRRYTLPDGTRKYLCTAVEKQ